MATPLTFEQWKDFYRNLPLLPPSGPQGPPEPGGALTPGGLPFDTVAGPAASSAPTQTIAETPQGSDFMSGLFHTLGLMGTGVSDIAGLDSDIGEGLKACLLYTSPSPRDRQKSRMPSSA